MTAPHNPTTGDTPYTGKNVDRLTLAAAEHGYPNAEWAGFGQWRHAGRTVRRGEHGTRLARVVVVTDEHGREKRAVTGLVVFNIAQTDPLPDREDVTARVSAPCGDADGARRPHPQRSSHPLELRRAPLIPPPEPDSGLTRDDTYLNALDALPHARRENTR